MKLCISMVGPKLSKKLHGKVIEMGNVKVSLHRGLYHKLLNDSPPDVVIGETHSVSACYLTLTHDVTRYIP